MPDGQLGRIEERLSVNTAAIAELQAEVMHPGKPDNLRGRVHRLESSDAAARAGAKAVEAARLVLRQASDTRWTTLQRLFAVIAVVGVIAAVVTPWALYFLTAGRP